MEYLPIQGRNFGPAALLTSSQKEEQGEWRKMKVLEKRENRGKVVSISYDPYKEDACVVAWSNDLEGIKAHDAKETMFKINSPFQFNSVRHRSDGALIVYAVGERGKVCVIDNQGKRLREFAHHRGTVLGAVFTCDKVGIASWGVDRQICLTSLATQEPVFSKSDAHDGAIFAGDTSMDNENLLATGCSDGIIKIWDIRLEKSALDIDLGQSGNVGGVSCLKFIPGTSNRIMYGTTLGHLRSVDLRLTNNENTAKLFSASTPHSKAVSDICFSNKATRVITVGLDGKLCISESLELNSLYSSHETCGGLTSVGCIDSGKEIAFGSENGILTRKVSADFTSVTETLFEQGAHWSLPTQKREIITPVIHKRTDFYLRTFSYKKSLLSALDEYEQKGEDSKVDNLYPLLEELFQRNALRIALSSWNERDLTRFLVYCITHMRHRQRCALIVSILEVVNEIYSEELIKSETIRDIFGGLKGDLKLYLESIRKSNSLVATIDGFL
ncbi:U3 small nucleolar RNA-associated protein [Perkinsela sp. CCAP 1560/4]|nr:U3 small nucleolar RNA-associated protein [Perkinsela sp. CCAP 1560/4]|eukprot:KNH09569.1 U3 small nucleolar RNA-associated protein [Perkinsela sp. CCAP 1560/4]